MRKSFRLLILPIILMTAACAPMVQRVGEDIRSENLTDTVFEAADGNNLPVQVWSAEEDEKAVIIAVHGFNDYRNGFSFPASWWMQNGITTYAFDQRGFGATDHRGIWAGSNVMIDDLAGITRLVRQKHPNKPVYLLGESMGGAVVMSSVASSDFPKVDGVILSAPAVWGWQSLNLFYRTVLWGGAHLFPNMTATGSGLGILASDNISMLRNLGRDPLFIKETRIDAVYGLVGLMDRAYSSAEKLDLPLLILYGANDEVIPKKPVENVVTRLPESADIVLYEKGWHLLLRDLQAPVVWNDIKQWIENREIPSGNQVDELPLFKQH
ncbi:MAG: lysophospholipase [Pseudomonas marincola]